MLAQKTFSRYVRCVILMVLLGISTSSGAAPPMPHFNVDLSQTSVSGMSSGAFMAVQFHIAFSSTLVGAGIVAGGPYYCTQGSFYALPFRIKQCMSPSFGISAPDSKTLFSFAKRFAKAQRIDPLANLKTDRVYIFSGTQDKLVSQKSVEQTREFYLRVGVGDNNLRYVDNIDAGHAFVTDDYGAVCDATKEPYINDCDQDQAGAILKHIYPGLKPPADAGRIGKIIAFSQAELTDSPARISMSDTGYLYVPNDCAAGTRCKVHVALHGCGQGADTIGDLYYRKTGYNRWAGANNIIILYPQAIKSGIFYPNPTGCWDWWGYTGKDYYNQNGQQIKVLMRMLRALAGNRNRSKKAN